MLNVPRMHSIEWLLWIHFCNSTEQLCCVLQFNHLSLSLFPVCLNLLAKLQRISVVLFSCQNVSRLNKCLFGVGTHIEGLKIRPCVGTPELLLHSSQVLQELLQVVPFQPNNDEASKALARRLDLCATASAWHCWLLADPVTVFYEYGVAMVASCNLSVQAFEPKAPTVFNAKRIQQTWDDIGITTPKVFAFDRHSFNLPERREGHSMPRGLGFGSGWALLRYAPICLHLRLGDRPVARSVGVIWIVQLPGCIAANTIVSSHWT